MKLIRLFFVVIFFCEFLAADAQHSGSKHRVLIVVFDGLRPDYITPENMPNVYALKEGGSYAAFNHSVFPTVTRVNASSYATGSYPARHGLLGNTVYFPSVNKTQGLNTGEAGILMQIAATENRLLTAVSVGEILHKAGSSMMVFSSGSSGQAFLQNHQVDAGGVINPGVILPASLKTDIYKNVGEPPPSAEPNIKQHEWAARAFLHYATKVDGPQLSAIWFSDPDGAAHANGIGSPEAMESIKAVDAQFGFIMQSLERKGLLDRFNILITADHGFVTHKGDVGLQSFLQRQGLKSVEDSEDVVVAGGALYVRDHDEQKIKRIVEALQEQPWVGAIFTKAAGTGSNKGWVEGTLSFESIHWNHDRAGDILVDYNWDHTANGNGYKGASFATGVAGHGGSSPYEINIPLIASGPAFKKEFKSSLPTSNIDIVPTVLHVLGLSAPAPMDGRVMEELLLQNPRQKLKAKLETTNVEVKRPWGTYRLTLQRTIVGKQEYVDFTAVERK